MKRMAFTLMVIGLLVFSTVSCSNPASADTKSDVRFQNNTDFTLFYGVKFGTAEYIGEVAPGFVSNYYSINAGTYSLQARDASSNWITISSGSLTVSAGHGFTIIGTGTGGTYYWGVVQDY